MFAPSPSRWLRLSTFGLIVVFITAASICKAATVNIQPGDDIPNVVAANPAGTTFVIYPGVYRLQNHIVPLDGDTFIGQTSCAPPTSSCPAILTGSQIIGPLAKFNGTNYEVTGQTQEGLVTLPNTICEPGYLACNLPEDLFFDGTPLQRLYATSLPVIGPGQWWFDYSTHIIYFHDNPSGHTVETSVLDTAFDTLANDVTIQYLTIEGFATPIQRGGIEPTVGNASPSYSANWVIRNCELYNNHADGVRIAFGTQVYNSYLHDNGNLGVGGGTDSSSASGVIVQGNTINHNNYAHMLPASGAGGLKFGYTANAIVRGNTISNNDGPGIHFDGNSAGPLVDDNVVTNNIGGNGFGYEISVNNAAVRNNILLENGVPGSVPATTAGVGSYDSVGMKAYCNVVELPYIGNPGPGVAANGITVGAADRGDNQFPPYEYLMSSGNTFHHNTVIWDANATGSVGYFQSDAAHQPNFFADNEAPDFNTYHLSSLSDAYFVFDNNNSEKNTRKTFADYQASGADVHGSADTNYTSGFPTVAITSPVDQSQVTNPVAVRATASDKSGINKVEFYADWELQTTVTSAPYSFTWNGTSGTHIISAMAYSNAGIRACYAVTLKEQ